MCEKPQLTHCIRRIDIDALEIARGLAERASGDLYTLKVNQEDLDVFVGSALAERRILSEVRVYDSRNQLVFAYSGVLFKRDGKRLELVATDGRRLALARANLTGQAEKEAKPVSCIVPTKALSMLLKLIGDPEEQVAIAITDNQIVFSLGGRAILFSNLVEGAFPPYEDAIPRDQDKKVTFDRDVLASAVRRAAVLTNEESRGVRMSFSGKDKRLELASRAPEMGEAEIKVDVAAYEGTDIEIGFNPAFIIDALKVMNEPQVIMELKAPSKPALIKSGQDFMYVVMPVALQ